MLLRRLRASDARIRVLQPAVPPPPEPDVARLALALREVRELDLPAPETARRLDARAPRRSRRASSRRLLGSRSSSSQPEELVHLERRQRPLVRELELPRVRANRSSRLPPKLPTGSLHPRCGHAKAPRRLSEPNRRTLEAQLLAPLRDSDRRAIQALRDDDDVPEAPPLPEPVVIIPVPRSVRSCTATCARRHWLAP